jgi:pseudouridylate synthase
MPFVALESTVIAHGLPYPENVETALRLEAIIRQEGATPRTVGIIDGEIIAGLTENQIERLGTEPDVRKVSRRDLPVVVAGKQHGATTVAATMWIAAGHGIEVFATGGIGGVHRGAAETFDVSTDLHEMAVTSVTVVSAGVKSILDIGATLEVLETLGVTVVGYETDTFPAFYSRTSGHAVDARCDDPTSVARIIRARRRMDIAGAVLVAVPVPVSAEIPAHEIEPFIKMALEEARSEGISTAAITPFLLDRLAHLTKRRSLKANIALLENNARVAARIAVALQQI